MLEICLTLSFLIIPFLLYIAFLTRKLDLNSDFIFLIFYGQVYIYIHVAPTIAMFSLDHSLHGMYGLIQWSVLFLFEIPLIVFYKYCSRRERIKNYLYRDLLIFSGEFNRLFFTLFLLGFSLSFLYISLENELFFRRIGHEGLALKSSAMSFLELLIYRSYSETSVFLLMISMFILFNIKNIAIPKKLLFVCAVVLHFAIYGSFILLNNRLQTAVLFVSVCLIYIYWRKINPRWPVFSIPKLFLIGFFLVLSGKLVMDLRTSYGETGGIDGYSISQFFSPSLVIDSAPLAGRLDGIELMAKITRPALEDGFLLGEAWLQPLKVYYFLIFDPKKAIEIKLELKTNPKVFIASRYLGDEIADAPSSMLTDIYGNYFVFAFPIVAVFLATVLGFITKQIFRPKSYRHLYLAIYLLPFIFKFEKEFLTFILNICKFSPVLILMISIKPFNILYSRVRRRYHGG